ncbi:MAG TPA: SDR family oxidoreductase, partial [Rudaea sp.]|nr:SDR family oxidoreductase [Rudaea sp.]
EDWHRVLDVSLDGTFHVCRAAVFAMMKRRTGSVVTISSVAGVHGNATQTNYSAAKAGVIGFTRALAKEVGRYGIRANVVAPGFIDTDMTRALSEDQRKALLGQIALGRLGSADDIAQAVLFLASPAAAYITGETLHVNGGMYMP